MLAANVPAKKPEKDISFSNEHYKNKALPGGTSVTHLGKNSSGTPGLDILHWLSSEAVYEAAHLGKLCSSIKSVETLRDGLTSPSPSFSFKF